MRPYYKDDFVTIFQGDAREILPKLKAETIITDPVWPNSSKELEGWNRPYELFAEIASLFPKIADRAIIQLGCDSDPSFLVGMPKEMPYLRTIWLEYACPTRKGRVLYTGDVAYAFGRFPKSQPGRRVLSGRFISTKPDAARVKLTKHKEFGKVPAKDSGLHPTPRRYQHVAYLVSKWVESCVIDPFCGSGTTLLAAKNAGYKSIGIEIEECYCEIAAKRMEQEILPMTKQHGGF